MKAPNRRTVLFHTTLPPSDIDIKVTASVYWSNGMDDKGYESGYIAEDIRIFNDAGEPLQVPARVLESLEDEAIKTYLEMP